MKKILFISNISNRISNFCLANIIAAKELGFDFYHAANWSGATNEQIVEEENKYGITIWNVPIQRSPFSTKNIQAYKQLVKLIEQEQIDFIHCNTPVGGLLGRLAGKKCKTKTIIYQAHGFHFYKGAPFLNWLIYYPVEKWLAHKTDLLITINKEDYAFAKKKMHLKKGGAVEYIPGVGIDLSNFSAFDNDSRSLKRIELGIDEDDVVVLSVGDLVVGKNHQCSLKAISKTKNKRIKLYICGEGPLKADLIRFADKLNIGDRVKFLGFRTDIRELLNASDVFLFASRREGLPRCLMEAMAAGLPCIASNIRGNKDLLENCSGGILCKPNDYFAYARNLDYLASHKATRDKMGKENQERIRSCGVDTKTIINELTKLYKEL